MGIDILIESKHLVLRLGYPDGEVITLNCSDFPLTRDVWYHLCVTHTKPRMAIFAKYELTVHIDGQVIYQGPVRFPLTSNVDTIMRNASIGDGFNGQMGPIHVLAEVLPQSVVQVIARHNASKACEGFLPSSAPDLLSSCIGQDKKVFPLVGKFASVYHPLRHADGSAIDVHGSLHGVLGPLTKPWKLCGLRDVVMSLGGILCLLPLFPKLLIENASLRLEIMEACAVGEKVDIAGGEWQGPSSAGLGTSLAEIAEDDAYLSHYGDTMIRYLVSNIDGIDNRPIALLLSLLARCIRSHRMNQDDLLHGGGIEMIEYALRGLPNQAQLLKQEGESCILALLELRSAAQEHSTLEAKITRRLLCNFSLWASASYALQASLYSVIVANIQAQPDVFMQIMGVQNLVDYMSAYYLHLNTSHGASNYGYGVEDMVGTVPLTPDSLQRQDGDRHSEGNVATPRKSGSQDMVSFRRAVTRRMSQIETPPVSGCKIEPVKRVTSMPGHTSWTSKKSREMSCHFDSFSGQLGELSSEEEEEEGEGKEEVDPRRSYLQDRLGRKAPQSDQHVAAAAAAVTAATTAVERDDDDDMSRGNTTCLDTAQRSTLRTAIESMIMIMIARGCGVSEIKPVLQFLSKSEDYVVVEELCQLLLCTIVHDTGRKIVTAITEVCKGTEEFGAFLINRFFNHTSEKLRSTSAALLVHYYMRVETIPSSVVNAYSKKKKGTPLSKAREKYSSMLEGQGMERLHACGGLALMCHIFDGYKRKCSEATYGVFLHLLLATHAGERQVSSSFRAMYVELCATSVSPSKPYAPSTAQCTPDMRIDESTEIKHSCALPAFFYVIPRLPMHVQEKVYVDLLSLIKHNAKNRDVICADPGWHMSLFDLVGQLMAVSEECTSHMAVKDIKEYLKEWAIYENPESEDQILVLFGRHSLHRTSVSPIKGLGLHGQDPSLPDVRSISLLTSGAHRRHSLEKQSLVTGVGTLDMWFDIGMKIYGTLLLHALDYKWGAKEIDKMIACSFDSDLGVAVSLAVLSHLLNEYTFAMQAKYKDMQRMAKSSSDEDNNEATVKLENILSVIYTLSLYMLEERQVAGLGVAGLSLGRYQ